MSGDEYVEGYADAIRDVRLGCDCKGTGVHLVMTYTQDHWGRPIRGEHFLYCYPCWNLAERVEKGRRRRLEGRA